IDCWDRPRGARMRTHKSLISRLLSRPLAPSLAAPSHPTPFLRLVAPPPSAWRGSLPDFPRIGTVPANSRRFEIVTTGKCFPPVDCSFFLQPDAVFVFPPSAQAIDRQFWPDDDYDEEQEEQGFSLAILYVPLNPPHEPHELIQPLAELAELAELPDHLLQH